LIWLKPHHLSSPHFLIWFVYSDFFFFSWLQFSTCFPFELVFRAILESIAGLEKIRLL